MPCLEISFALDGLDPAIAEAICFDSGALSVTLSHEAPRAGDDPHAGAVFEPAPGEVRLWNSTRLEALFAAEQAGVELLVGLAQRLGREPAHLRTRAVAERVWEREWLRDFHAMQFGRRLWVCPRHESVPAEAATRAGGKPLAVVRLDPGLAFGTGTHASTAMCLEWLESRELCGQAMIDYGSGSGVLAIAALKLGAGGVHAFDSDPQARLATRENAADNGVADQLHLCERATELPRDCALLVSNIVSDTLLELAPQIARLVAPRGALLLSGILAPQEAEVAARYAAWFDIERYALREGWIALQGRRFDRRDSLDA